MSLQPTETVTMGTLLTGLIAAIVLFLRNMGKRADPVILDLLKQSMTGYTELKKAIENSNDVNAQLNDRMNEESRLSREAHQLMIDQFQPIVQAINAIPGKIAPTIDALTSQLAKTEKSHEGVQSIMNNVINSQGATNGEILSALLRIEASLDAIKNDLQPIQDRLSIAEEEIKTVKTDFQKSITQETDKVEDKKTDERPKRKSTRLDHVGGSDSGAIVDDSGDDSKTISSDDYSESAQPGSI
jgi:chromosome segregation ATPase